MSEDVKDYSSTTDSHYCGVPSQFGKRVDSQNKMQPKYCEPGEASKDSDSMKGEKRNVQAGP